MAADTSSSWLHVRLYGRPEMQDTLLAERLPAVLESLPSGVHRWFFLRWRSPAPHLSLSFSGEASALHDQLLDSLHCWLAELAEEGLASHLAPGSGNWVIERAPVRAGVEEVHQADSDAVLTQLRLANAEAFTVPADLLVAAGLAHVVRSFCGDDEWGAHWAPTATPSRPSFALQLAPSWDQLAVVLRKYGRQVHLLAARNNDPGLITAVLNELLRMHHNRAASVASPAFQMLRATATPRG